MYSSPLSCAPSPSTFSLKKKEKQPAQAATTGTSKRFERLKRLNALRSQQNAEPEVSRCPWCPFACAHRRSQWEQHVDEESGSPFWYNPTTGETTWDDPYADDWEEVSLDWKGSAFLSLGFTLPRRYRTLTRNQGSRSMSTRKQGKPVGRSQVRACCCEQRLLAVACYLPGVCLGAAAGKVWSSHVDPESGDKFYSNAITGETTWTRPDGYVSDTEEKTEESKSPWRAVVDEETGDKFYFNDATGESQWERPEGYESEGEGDDDWIEVRDDESGEVYYYNEKTGVSAGVAKLLC